MDDQNSFEPILPAEVNENESHQNSFHADGVIGEPSNSSFQREDFRGGDGETLLCIEVDNKLQNKDFASARALIEIANFKCGPEMLVACDVLCAASMVFPDYGIDWYWVLQVFPTADTNTIEAKYRKMTTQLEAIHAGFQSRDSALQLLQDAYSVLSDPSRRSSFNHKRDCAWKLLDNSYSGQKSEPTIRNVAPISGTTKMMSDTNRSDPPSFGRVERFGSGEGQQPLVSDSQRSQVKESSPKASCSGEGHPNHHDRPSSNATSSDEPMPNLKAKWSINDFAVDQVWAIYDLGPFPLPRFYAKVVDMVPPSNVRVAFLEPNPRLEEEIHWVEGGLPVTCGVFRVSRDVVDVDITRFSHVVKCELSTGRSFYRIYPRKGEIWALHKNWHSNWNPTDYIKRWCQIVEILSDFSNDECCKVCSLVEVGGYMTFFKRKLYEESMLVKKFSWSEMLSFSHQIPAYTIVGLEDRRMPKESWHLEPDALPLKLDNSCNVA